MQYASFGMKTLFSLIVITSIVSGCNKSEQRTVIPSLTAITSDDICHVCGMTIANFPGPKGQAFIRHQSTALKFCSTVDLFSWLLQPDTPAVLQSAYVHDMGAAPSWDKPSDEHYVEVKHAWYVTGHGQPGAMGPTLASFKEKQVAESFMKQHGGHLLRFDDIDLTLLSNLPHPHSHR